MTLVGWSAWGGDAPPAIDDSAQADQLPHPAASGDVTGGQGEFWPWLELARAKGAATRRPCCLPPVAQKGPRVTALKAAERSKRNLAATVNAAASVLQAGPDGLGPGRVS